MKTNFITIFFVLLFVSIAANAFAVKKAIKTSDKIESAGRKQVSLDVISGDTTQLNGFSVFPNYLDGCYSMARTVDMSALSKSLYEQIEEYNNEDKYFYLATTVFGLGFVSNYKVNSKKDICLIYILKGESQFPRYVIRIANKEIKKLNNRDFGKADSKLVNDLKAMPYNTPPYPLIEMFKNANIYQVEFSKDGQRHLEKDEQATEKYHLFLKNFQFPRGAVSESSVEDVYAKYLDMKNEVYQCVLANDLQCVQNFKRMGFDLNTYSTEKEPLLMFSIRANKSEITDFLLKNGADPNIADSNGATPLMLSVVKQDLKSTKSLVKHGADPNKRTVSGVLALDIAKNIKFKPITEYLSKITTEKSQETPVNSTSSNGSSCDFINVNFDVVAGFSTQGVDRVFSMSAVDNATGSVKQDYSKTGATILRSYNKSLAGYYTWNALWDNNRKGCSGRIYVSGEKCNVSIRVYGDCSDAGTQEF